MAQNNLAPGLPAFQQNQLAPQPSWADAYSSTTGAVGDYIAQQRAQAIAQGLLDPNTGMPTALGMKAAGQAYAGGMGVDAAGMSGGMVGGIKAYHGSPHSFESFSNSAIGSGEGAQAFGHGHYFAENESIAKWYRDALTEAKPPQELIDAQTAYNQAYMDGSNAMSGTKAEFDAAMANTKAAAIRLNSAKELPNVPGPPGSIYQVDLNMNPDHMLDWNKPLSQQTQHVQDALGVTSKPTYEDQMSMLSSLRDQGVLPEQTASHPEYQAMQRRLDADPNINGVQLAYDAVGADAYRAMGSPTNAAAQLQAAGIPGIRYLDGGSRADGSGTSNYVAFDPANIEIMRKYGLLGTAGAGAAAAAGAQQPDQPANRLAPDQNQGYPINGQ